MHERVSRKKLDLVDKQAGKVPDTQTRYRPARKVRANIKDKDRKAMFSGTFVRVIQSSLTRELFTTRKA